MIQTPMPQSTVTGWQERPHEIEFDGQPFIRFRLDKVYLVPKSQAEGLTDDEIAARFARPAVGEAVPA